MTRELRPAAVQVEALSANAENASSIQPIRRRSKYMAAELNTLCNLKVTMPDDLVAWEAMKPMASESS
jgi:hypothetical protein